MREKGALGIGCRLCVGLKVGAVIAIAEGCLFVCYFFSVCLFCDGSEFWVGG